MLRHVLRARFGLVGLRVVAVEDAIPRSCAVRAHSLERCGEFCGDPRATLLHVEKAGVLHESASALHCPPRGDGQIRQRCYPSTVRDRQLRSNRADAYARVKLRSISLRPDARRRGRLHHLALRYFELRNDGIPVDAVDSPRTTARQLTRPERGEDDELKGADSRWWADHRDRPVSSNAGAETDCIDRGCAMRITDVSTSGTLTSKRFGEVGQAAESSEKQVARVYTPRHATACLFPPP